MGIAGGWFVLGLGWIVEDELHKESERKERAKTRETEIKAGEFVQNQEGSWERDQDGAVVFGLKARDGARMGREARPMVITAIHQTAPSDPAQSALPSPASTVPSTSQNGSSKTEESTMVKTPCCEENTRRPGMTSNEAGSETEKDPYDRLKLMVSSFIFLIQGITNVCLL